MSDPHSEKQRDPQDPAPDHDPQPSDQPQDPEKDKTVHGDEETIV